MQHHGAQTAAHGVEVDVDIDLEGDAAVAHEDELHATIEQLNGMMSGNQVSATPVGSVASASAATEDDVAAVTAATQLDSDTATADIVPLELNGEMVDRQGGSVATAEPTMPMSPAVTAATGQAAPAAAPQNIEVAASPEATADRRRSGLNPTSDAAQGNETIVQAAPELVDNNDVKPIIRLDAATPTTATSQITPAAAQTPSAPSSTGLHSSSPRTHRKHHRPVRHHDCRSPFDPMTSAQSNSKFVPERTASKSLPRPPTNQVGLPLNLSSLRFVRWLNNQVFASAKSRLEPTRHLTISPTCTSTATSVTTISDPNRIAEHQKQPT